MTRTQDNQITSGLHYGNWCGPGWSAGQAKDSADLTYSDFDVPAIDELDQACKNHDIGLRLAETREDVERVNGEFEREATRAGILGTAFAFMVKNLGPTEPGKSFSNLPCQEEIAVSTAGKTTKPFNVFKKEIHDMKLNNNVLAMSEMHAYKQTEINHQRLQKAGQYQNNYQLTLLQILEMYHYHLKTVMPD